LRAKLIPRLSMRSLLVAQVGIAFSVGAYWWLTRPALIDVTAVAIAQNVPVESQLLQALTERPRGRDVLLALGMVRHQTEQSEVHDRLPGYVKRLEWHKEVVLKNTRCRLSVFAKSLYSNYADPVFLLTDGDDAVLAWRRCPKMLSFNSASLSDDVGDILLHIEGNDSVPWHNAVLHCYRISPYRISEAHHRPTYFKGVGNQTPFSVKCRNADVTGGASTCIKAFLPSACPCSRKCRYADVTGGSSTCVKAFLPSVCPCSR